MPEPISNLDFRPLENMHSHKLATWTGLANLDVGNAGTDGTQAEPVTPELNTQTHTHTHNPLGILTIKTN